MQLEVLFALLILLATFGLLVLDRKLAIYVLLILSVLLHKELFSIYQWNIMPIRIFMVGFLAWAALSLFLSLIRQKNLKEIRRTLFSPFVLILSALWLIRGISLIFTQNLSASFNLFAFFTTVVALGIFMFVFLKNNPNLTVSYLRFYFFVAFVLTLFALLQVYLFYQEDIIAGALWDVPGRLPRLGSLFWDVNHFGGFLAALIPLVLAMAFSSKKIRGSLVYILMLAPVGLVLFLTSSRTAWIVAFVGMVAFITLVLYRKIGLKGFGTIFVVLAIIFGVLFGEYGKKESRFRETVNNFLHYRLDSFDAHFMLIEGSLEIFEKYPFLGGGYGGFFEHFTTTEVAPEYFIKDPIAFTTRVPAHTIWGEALSETGIFGFSALALLFLLVLGTLLFVALNSTDSGQMYYASAMFSSLLGWLIAGIFYSYNSEFFFIVLFLYYLYAVSALGKSYDLNKLLLYFKDKTVLGPAFIFLLSLVLIFSSLGKNHLLPWDEAIYAQVAKNIVNTGEYLVQTWMPGKLWFEKPPLYMWAMAGFMRVLGVSEWMSRLPSAISGFSIVLAVYFFAKKRLGKSSAFIAALALLTTVHFLYYSRAAMIDIMVTLFVTSALFLYYVARHSNRTYLWALSGLSIGLAVMSKGVIGLLPFPIIALYEVYNIFFLHDKPVASLFCRYLILALYSLVAMLPWHLYMYARFGQEFFDSYIGYHVFERATSAIEGKGQPFYWYLIVLKVSMRIWFVALIPAFFCSVYKAFKKDRLIAFLVIWVSFVLLFFSSSASKLIWYIIPIYPAAALLIGRFVQDSVGWITNVTPKLSLPISRFFIYFSLVVFVLTYFYFQKDMVYMDDLAGSPSGLLEYKDIKYGLEKKLFVTDVLEYPLALFYTNGPFEQVNYDILHKTIENTKDDDFTVFLSKQGWYSRLDADFPRIEVVLADGDWVLGELPVVPPVPVGPLIGDPILQGFWSD